MSDRSPEATETPPPAGGADADKPRDPQQFFMFACLFEGGLVFLAAALGWVVGFSPVESFSWNVSAVVWGVLATVPLLALMFLLDKLPWKPLAHLREVVDRVIRPAMAPFGIFEFAAISLFAGIGEETLFRGFVQGWLSADIDSPTAPWIALVVASLLFGVMHPITRTYAVLCTIMGFYFGLLWMLTGNLLAPIIAHALYDFIALVYLMRFTSSDVELAEEKTDKQGRA